MFRYVETKCSYVLERSVFADVHTVSAVAGYSYWENNSENFNMTNYDFPVDGLGAWDMGTVL